MLRLVTHLERLLLVRDCVIVPNLGGFVVQSVPAAYDANKHLFRPMRKELLFNSTLKHQDGLLAESYMKQYQVDYRKAVSMIEEEVHVLLTRLNATREFDLSKIGCLRLGDEGQYVFQPAEDDFFSVESYGLPSFYFTPLSLLKKEDEPLFIPTPQQESRRKDIYIRVNRNVLRTLGAAAAVTALVLLISTPIKQVNPARYTASFIPTEITVPTEASVSPDPTIPATEEVEMPAEVVEIQTAVEAEPEVRPVAVKSGKTYYAVIGSFPNETLGNKFISESVDKKQFPNVGFVIKDGKVRVYSDKFDNREAAEAYVNTLRGIEQYKNTWLFISR